MSTSLAKPAAKKENHTRRLHGMLVPEKLGQGRGAELQLVTASGKEYRIVPDVKGKRLWGLVWLNVEVEGQLFEFSSGVRLLKVQHYHSEDLILDRDKDADLDELTTSAWEHEIGEEDMLADAQGIYA